MLESYSKVKYKLQMLLLEFYHKVLTFTISQMNTYCLIIPSIMYFALNSIFSKLTKLNFRKSAFVYLIHKPRGGCEGGPAHDRKMSVTFGGLIDQSMKRDPGTHKWIPMQTKLFNVQILNTPNFQRVTGFSPPQPSIDTRTFARYSNPFLSIYEEPTTVAGDFATLKSVGQDDGLAEPRLGPHPVNGLTHRASKPETKRATEVGFLSPNRPFSLFKSVEELEAELRT